MLQAILNLHFKKIYTDNIENTLYYIENIVDEKLFTQESAFAMNELMIRLIAI